MIDRLDVAMPEEACDRCGVALDPDIPLTPKDRARLENFGKDYSGQYVIFKTVCVNCYRILRTRRRADAH